MSPVVCLLFLFLVTIVLPVVLLEFGLKLVIFIAKCFVRF